MSDIEKAFSRITGRDPTDEEKLSFLRASEALGMKSDDAMWVFIFHWQHYQTETFGRLKHYEDLYATIPERIQAAAEACSANSAAKFKAEIRTIISNSVANSEPKKANSGAFKVLFYLLLGMLFGAGIFEAGRISATKSPLAITPIPTPTSAVAEPAPTPPQPPVPSQPVPSTEKGNPPIKFPGKIIIEDLSEDKNVPPSTNQN